ncbi:MULTISPECIES: MqnA/MqnD/SBP family protein [unclassified Paenibacillus]|uniref:MqnA/MqnD/SBP family protein n=1 Tax=unclassified Paenibacillus TaxID=185978 RepID=UPI002119556F|nr:MULTISPECIES: MqnA/MqnD/SBP family protein [unclassified Paenibacillus]
MSKRNLKIGSTFYLHTMPLLHHAIETKGFDYTAENVKTIDECTLRTLKGDFDIGEMSLATFLKVQETDSSLKALPVFARKIPQVYAFCSRESGLNSYKDLRGKKVAVFQYWVTASIWHRWLLTHHYGVDAKDIIWCPLRKDRMDNMPYPEDHQIHWDYVEGTPEELLRSGQIDCFFYARKPDRFDGLRWLFPPSPEEQIQFVHHSGITPITHVMAIKDEIVQSSPEIIDEVMEVYEKSKAMGYREAAHMASLYLPFADWHLHQTESGLGGRDWNENGWSENKTILETFYQACIEQGFIQQPYDLSDSFIPYDYEK